MLYGLEEGHIIYSVWSEGNLLEQKYKVNLKYELKRGKLIPGMRKSQNRCGGRAWKIGTFQVVLYN